jgi:hypothetical protein
MHKTDHVSTLKPNRKSGRQETEKSEIIAQHCGPVSVTKWSDKKVTTMISTYYNHHTTATIRRKETLKPISVLDYNQGMGGVDLKD